MRGMLIGVAIAAVSGGIVLAQQDFSQVQIKTTKIGGNFYTLDGSGGTIGVLAGPDGVLMVDAQFAPLSDKIVAAIKQISDGRVCGSRRRSPTASPACRPPPSACRSSPTTPRSCFT